MVLLNVVTILLLSLVTDVSKFKFALFTLTGGTLSYDLVEPTNPKSILDEIKRI
jgi:hypothetical protein